jgi:hypothetical protein
VPAERTTGGSLILAAHRSPKGEAALPSPCEGWGSGDPSAPAVGWGGPRRFWLAQSRMFPAVSSWRNLMIGQMWSGPSLSSADPVYTPCPAFSTP